MARTKKTSVPDKVPVVRMDKVLESFDKINKLFGDEMEHNQFTFLEVDIIMHLLNMKEQRVHIQQSLHESLSNIVLVKQQPDQPISTLSDKKSGIYS